MRHSQFSMRHSSVFSASELLSAAPQPILGALWVVFSAPQAARHAPQLDFSASQAVLSALWQFPQRRRLFSMHDRIPTNVGCKVTT